MSARGRWPLALASTLLGLVLVLLLLEGIFRLLPVNQTMGSMPVDETNPVLRYIPNRTTRWSTGPRFCLVNTVHANNYGFINDQDYDPKAPAPLVAVVGDSYVEALMVPYARTGHGLLAQALSGGARVYSFARSGAPLSQYLAYAQWARDEFRPRKLVILIIGNDYDESLLEYKSAPGFHYYRETPEGLALTRVDYRPGLGSRLVGSSRLLLYLFTNLKFLELPAQLRNRFAAAPGGYAGNTGAEAGQERIAASRRAVEKALEELPARAGLPAAQICLVVNGLVPEVYDQQARRTAQASYAGRMNAHLMERARALGFRVIDMQPVLERDYDRNRQSFDLGPCDGHWNARAHALFAQAVLDSGFLDDLKAGR